MFCDKLKSAAAYIRVSTGEQTEFSPESQLDRIREYARIHGYQISEKNIFADCGISGKSAAKRAAFQLMIEKARQKPKPFEAILVWKFSRFARNREDSIIYKSMLRKKYGIKVISVSEDIGSDKLSLLIESMIEAMDEFYSLNLGEEVKRGMKKRAEKGKFQSRPPFGYRIIQGELTPDSLDKEYVGLIFDRFLKGENTAEISDLLNSLGVKTANGNRWNSRSVSYILKNPLYAGYVSWKEKGEVPVLKKGCHLPLVSAEAFHAAGKLLDSKAGRKLTGCKKAYLSEKPFYLELLRCSSCGGRFCLCGDGKNLQCINYIKKKCSVSHSISAKKMTASLENFFSGFFESFTDLCNEKNNSDLSSKAQQYENKYCPNDNKKITFLCPSEEKNSAESLLAEAERRYKRAKEAYISGIYTLQELQASFDEVKKIKKRLFPRDAKPQQTQKQPQRNNEALDEALKEALDETIDEALSESKNSCENTEDKNQKNETSEKVPSLLQGAPNFSEILFRSELLSSGEKLALLSSVTEKIVFHRPQEKLEIFFYI